MPRPLSYFPNRLRPAPDWIIPGFLKRENTAFIIGQPKKACKSWLLLHLAWDLSEGKPLWSITHSRTGPVFKPPRAMRVAYFAQEDTEDDLQDRIEIITNNGRLPNANVQIIPKDLSLLINQDNGYAKIIAELDLAARAAGGIDLVILDPMRRMHSEKENDSDGMAKIWQACDSIHRRYHCSTIFSHHTIKPPTEKGNKYDPTSPYAGRGSGDIYGAGDAFINVVPVATKGQPATYQCEQLTFTTKRGGTPTAAQVRVKFDTGEVLFEQFLP